MMSNQSFISYELMGMDDATLKDLAFKCRSSREAHVVDRRVCLSGASYAAAEKSGI